MKNENHIFISIDAEKHWTKFNSIYDEKNSTRVDIPHCIEHTALIAQLLKGHI